MFHVVFNRPALTLHHHEDIDIAPPLFGGKQERGEYPAASVKVNPAEGFEPDKAAHAALH